MEIADCGSKEQFLSVSGSIEFTDKCQADRLVLFVQKVNPSFGKKNSTKTFCGEFSWMAKIDNSTKIEIEFVSDDKIELGGFKLDFVCEKFEEPTYQMSKPQDERRLRYSNISESWKENMLQVLDINLVT